MQTIEKNFQMFSIFSILLKGNLSDTKKSRNFIFAQNH